MDVFEAIKSRRSIGRVKTDEVPAELIEKILESGTYAPSHFRTEPWRFFVLRQNGREKLGEVLANITKAELGDSDSSGNNDKIERAKKNPLRAPVIITVAVEPSNESKVILKEEYAAVSSAIQNMLLAATALGLGAVWRTGKICYEKKVSEFFGLSEKGEVLGFIYLGYPDMEAAPIERTNFKDKTTWID
ncbi:nitroreductase family protein [Metabacillus fastidiosus]|uniref:Putative NAD(P)H nitroreductase n=1 Tax=Metabacillus fastidiosus TaxID=1458 RepID=A0ABU6P2X4_9BACI|nr:nitroreductase [Metabacillus fastidiosus]MED4403636.1 nitroreductase [Metabacillus fastidiosus]MED4463637.1 nitroreductase [Metabacillus fastidiosus]